MQKKGHDPRIFHKELLSYKKTHLSNHQKPRNCRKGPRNVKGSPGNSGGPRYALDAWARFELLGAPRGPCGDRTSAEDLHLNFTDTWTTLYLLKFLNKQQHTDTGHQLQNNVSQ